MKSSKKGLQTLVGTRGIKEFRGYGGLIGMVLSEEPGPTVMKLTQAGLLTVAAANNTVRFLPPLNVTPEEVTEALRIVRENL